MTDNVSSGTLNRIRMDIDRSVNVVLLLELGRREGLDQAPRAHAKVTCPKLEHLILRRRPSARCRPSSIRPNTPPRPAIPFPVPAGSGSRRMVP